MIEIFCECHAFKKVLFKKVLFNIITPLNFRKHAMKMIINTALVAGILIALLFFMRRETEALNSKIQKLNDVEKNSIEIVEPNVSSANQFIQ